MGLTTILLSGFFAGLVAILITVVVEKYGGLVGGIIGTVPTTIIPAAIGFYLESSDQEASMSLAVVPFGMLINAVFLLCWIIFPKFFGKYYDEKKTLLLTTFFGLIVWMILGITMLSLVEIAIQKGITSFQLGFIGLFLFTILGIASSWTPREAPRGENEVSKSVLFFRGIAAATFIGLAVLISSLDYPLLAGLVSVFPAIFLTSMIALWISQGPSVPIGATGPMMLGAISVAIYALIAMWALPAMGYLWGSIIGWLISTIIWSTPAYFYLKRKHSKYFPIEV